MSINTLIQGPITLRQVPKHMKNTMRASVLASIVHGDQQYRPMEPSSVTPYPSHLMGVAAIVYQYGGTHAEATAAYLHDVVEDHPERFGGREKALAFIAAEFGQEVADIVAEVTDPDVADAAERKAMVNELVAHRYSSSAWLVKAADFLNTLNAVLASILCWGPNATFQGFLANDAGLPITEQLDLWVNNNKRLSRALRDR